MSDPTGTVARSVGVVERSSRAQELEAIGELVGKWEVAKVVVGYPRLLSGEIGQEARFAQAYAEALAENLAMEVELWDERLSTVTAQRLLRERGVRARSSRRTVDSVAAAVILQDYLEAHREQNWGRRQASEGES